MRMREGGFAARALKVYIRDGQRDEEDEKRERRERERERERDPPSKVKHA
jgi:hypothetical protein